MEVLINPPVRRANLGTRRFNQRRPECRLSRDVLRDRYRWASWHTEHLACAKKNTPALTKS